MNTIQSKTLGHNLTSHSWKNGSDAPDLTSDATSDCDDERTICSWSQVKKGIQSELQRLDTVAIDRLVELEEILTEDDETTMLDKLDNVNCDLDRECQLDEDEIRWSEVKRNIRCELQRLDTLAIDRLVELGDILDEPERELEKLESEYQDARESTPGFSPKALEVSKRLEESLDGLSRMGTLQVQEHIRAELERLDTIDLEALAKMEGLVTDDSDSDCGSEYDSNESEVLQSPTSDEQLPTLARMDTEGGWLCQELTTEKILEHTLPKVAVVRRRRRRRKYKVRVTAKSF